MSALRQLALLIALAVLAPAVAAETAFTYQGRLSTAGAPAQGSYDFRFRLFDAEAGGTAVGSLLSSSGVAVSGGVFSVLLDFGDGPFNSAPRWLEIEVREAGGGSYTVLTPRQRVGASPFAIETMFVAPGAVDTAALQDDAVTTQKIVDGSVFTDDLANFAVATGKLSNQAVTRLKIADDAIGTAQIENNTVTSADIRDGTVTHSDVADGGGLLHRKAELQRVQGTASTVSPNSSRLATASCADENDIPIAYECEVVTTIHVMVMREATTENWDNPGAAASATCAFQNTHPSIGADVRASIICVNVPGP